MKPRIIIIWLCVCTFIVSCDRKNASNTSSTNKEILPDLEKSEFVRKVLDTSIIAKNIATTEGGRLDTTAKAAVIRYFKGNGVLVRNELRDSLFEMTRTLIIDIDTLFDIKTEKFTGSIVCYWLGPYDLNGHCFRTNKALVIFKDEYYSLNSEEIIPQSWEIDSVKNDKIFGYEYECGGRGILRNVTVSLK